MKNILYLLAITFFGNISAQTFDLNGKWRGSDTSRKDYSLTLELNHKGKEINGSLKAEYKWGGRNASRPYIKFNIKGKLTNNKLTFSEIKMIERILTGGENWCKKIFNGSLELNKTGNIEKLKISGRTRVLSQKKTNSNDLGCKQGSFFFLKDGYKEITIPKSESFSNNPSSYNVNPIYKTSTFIIENVIKRGYLKPTFLANDEKRAYYLVRQVNDKKQSVYEKDYAVIIVIHDIKENESILNLTPLIKNGVQSKNYHIIKNSESQIAFFKSKLLPIISRLFPQTPRRFYFNHFVKDNHIQLYDKTNKHPDPKVENALIKNTIYLNRQGKYDFLYFHGGLDLSTNNYQVNSIAEAKEIRKRYDKKTSVKQEKLLAQEAKIKQNFAEINYPYFEPEFWNKFKHRGDLLRKIYEGNYKGSAKLDIYFMFTSHISYMSTNCKNLLPKNAKTLEFEHTIPPETKTETSLLPGGGLLNKTTHIPGKTVRWEITLDPKYEEIYLETKDKLSLANRNVLFSFNSKLINDVGNGAKDIAAFNQNIGCNERALSLYRENLVRLLKNEYSVQEEVERAKSRKSNNNTTVKINPVYDERGRRTHKDYLNWCDEYYSYRVEVVSLKWIPPNGEVKSNSEGTYIVEIRDPIYKDIPSRVFEITGTNPKYPTRDRQRDLMSGRIKSYWTDLGICEEKIKDGKLNQTPFIGW